MTEITMENIKLLRERSGVGMMDCKKALKESNGDIEAAVDYLRKQGLATANKKADRETFQGLISLMTKGTTGVMVEVNCETDFVARNEKFQSFVTKVTEKAFSADSLESLKKQKLEGERSIEENLTDLIGSIGENININGYDSIKLEEGLVSGYIHGQESHGMGKIGVLVGLKTSKPDNDKIIDLGKKLAMHIAATNPSFCKRDDVDEQSISRERSILTEQAQGSGKPDAVIEKMVEGRMRKFYEENVLEEQTFVIDNETKIKDLVAQVAKDVDNNLSLSKFTYMRLGQSS